MNLIPDPIGRAGAPLAESAKWQSEPSPDTSLFAKLELIQDDDSSRLAALNMAVDEALLDSATVPAIRFYRWDHPALSFGYFGKLSAVEQSERDSVRRWTGGGIVYHGEDLTYAVVIPSNDAVFAESATAIYRKIHEAMCLALEASGIAAIVTSTASKVATDERSYRCFENPVLADVMSNGRKIAGAAQRRTRRGLLQQGSIQIGELNNDFAARFAGELSTRLESRPFDSAFLNQARELAQRKYGNQAWLRKW